MPPSPPTSSPASSTRRRPQAPHRKPSACGRAMLPARLARNRMTSPPSRTLPRPPASHAAPPSSSAPAEPIRGSPGMRAKATPSISPHMESTVLSSNTAWAEMATAIRSCSTTPSAPSASFAARPPSGKSIPAASASWAAAPAGISPAPPSFTTTQAILRRATRSKHKAAAPTSACFVMPSSACALASPTTAAATI